MENINLKNIITNIINHVESNNLTSHNISIAVSDLQKLGFKYNDDMFPKLNKTDTFIDESGLTPSNLSEALIWKLGKWNSYKKMARQFTDDASCPSTTDVVFYAFARHLKNPENPIYDQHTLRAMWAINTTLDAKESSKIKATLLNGKNKWKSAASGRYTIDCYDIYRIHLINIIKDKATLREIDQLLMPLGQAIKKQTEGYNDFLFLTTLNNN